MSFSLAGTLPVTTPLAAASTLPFAWIDQPFGLMAGGALLGQASWLPAWLTPLWMIAVGLGLGALALIAVFGSLAALSFIPGLGTLADSPRRAIVASLLVGSVLAAGLCLQFIRTDQDYYESLFLPLITLGLLLGFGLVYGLWHRTRSEWPQLLREGVVPYLLSVAGCFGVIGLASTPLVPNPMAFLQSIPEVNLLSDGMVTTTVPVPGNETNADPDLAPFYPADLQYRTRGLARMSMYADRTVLISDSDDPAAFTQAPFQINADETLTFNFADLETPPILKDSAQLFIQNREFDPANVVFTFAYIPKIPQVTSIVTIGTVFFLTMTGLMVFRQAAPRVWAMALSTTKNEMAQPLYLLLLGIGLFLVLLFGIYPFNTLGDDIRVLKDSGVTMIMVLGMIQAIWSAGTSISDEIEGRTALTVLSKPISRRSFILGKYAGIMLSVLVLFVIIGAVLLIVMSYKPIFEARETTRAATTWHEGHEEIVTTLPLLALYFMETMAVGAIAVALATRLPLLANFIACLVVYVIGNLTSPLVAASQGNSELVGFVGKLIAVVVPNLNNFNVQSAIDVGNPIPTIYLCGAFNYLVCFTIAAWMLAMLLFEDRDLA